jgi:hypothetical protein
VFGVHYGWNIDDVEKLTPQQSQFLQMMIERNKVKNNGG